MKNNLIELIKRWVKSKLPFEGHKKLIELIYREILKRKPSSNALKNHLKQLKTSKRDIGLIIRSLLNSQEFLLSEKPKPELTLISAYGTLMPEKHRRGNPLVIWYKPPVVFLHMLKTGGTTLDNWINQYFHPLQICPFAKGRKPASCPEEELLKYRLITGHMDFVQTSLLPYQEKLIITLLRDPKKRVYSLYHFLKSHHPKFEDIPDRGNMIQAARRNDFKTFLKLPGEVRNHCDNYYLRVLTGSWIDSFGHDPLRENIEQQLVIAKNNLSLINAVGILEEFEASVRLFCKVLQVNEVDIESVKASNVLAERQNNPNDKGIQKTEYAVIDDEVAQLLSQCTQYDQILYEYGKEIFARQQRAENIIAEQIES